jgi:cyclopropane-fatty-acyl-phospholipid synthase
MFIEYRLETLFKRIPAGFTIPLRIVLWNGREFNLSSEPTVTIHVPTPSALRYFIPPDLNKLGAAFVEGHIRVEGSIHELFRVAESLVSSVAAHNTRARFHWFTRHSHRRDREAYSGPRFQDSSLSCALS